MADQQLRVQDLQAFWKRIKIDPKTECWNWIGAVSTFGSPRIHVGGCDTSARRLSYVIHYGASNTPPRVHAACKNRMCVSPQHFSSVPKARQLIGKSYVPKPRLKFSEKVVAKILALHDRGFNKHEISKKTGVNYAFVVHVVNMASLCRKGKLAPKVKTKVAKGK